MSTHSEDEITIRRVSFPFPEGLDPVLVEGQPEESYTIVGLSLLLPYLEPYLIRSMQAAKPRVTEPRLLRQLELFNGQEGQHYRQHIRFNEAIRLAGFEKLKELEAELERDYLRYTRKRSLRFNLAYAEGFEAFTSAMALHAFQVRLAERMHPAAGELFQWHLIEELEHRTVAFDVYAHVFGGYFYRLVVGLFAQWHLNQFVLRVAITMLRTDPAGFRKQYGGLGKMLGRLARQLKVLARSFLPKVLATYLPGYTPHRIKMPEAAKALANHYAELALKPASRPQGAPP